MEFKDYYAALGVAKGASQEEIKRAYRKLARKFHPDVSKVANAEARFKEVAEAHEALIDPERRTAYDEVAARHARGESFDPQPGWNSGFETGGRGAASAAGDDQRFGDFFDSIFGRSPGGAGGSRHAGRARPAQGEDHHAKVLIELLDSYHGAQRMFSLRMPVADARGGMSMQDRQLEVNIPKGVRAGQHLRLSGQGAAGQGGAAAGDLYLEIQFKPHKLYSLEDRDVFTDLPIAPWEAALGATVETPTPEGAVHLTVPAGSIQGRRLRLKGRGLPASAPGAAPGDLYAVLQLTLPPADTEPAREAWAALARAFPHFSPRPAQET
jgi:curved DNA-binding protein